MEMHSWPDFTVELTKDRSIPQIRRPAGISDRRWKYLVLLRELSAEVDAFVQKVSAMPGWGDTLFVIVSDHGEGLDDHPGVQGAWRHGFVLYESNIVVPWFMLHTGGALPTDRIARQVELLDLTPTILDLLGLPVPSGLDGVSLAPLIQDPDSVPKQPPLAITESRFRGSRKIAVIGESWSYFVHRDGWRGTRPSELWATGGSTPTNPVQRPRISQRLVRSLELWEENHDEVSPSEARQPISDDTVEQMKALGYLE